VLKRDKISQCWLQDFILFKAQVFPRDDIVCLPFFSPKVAGRFAGVSPAAVK
jgi:hypothetical protein